MVVSHGISTRISLLTEMVSSFHLALKEFQVMASYTKWWSPMNYSRMGASRFSTSTVAMFSIHLKPQTLTQNSLTGSVQSTDQDWKTTGPQSTQRTFCSNPQGLGTIGVDLHGFKETGQWTWPLWMPLTPLPLLQLLLLLNHPFLPNLKLPITILEQLAQ